MCEHDAHVESRCGELLRARDDDDDDDDDELAEH